LSGIFDHVSSKFLLKSVGRQLATFARILVAKYFFPLAMATKMVAAWSAAKREGQAGPGARTSS